MGSYHVTLWIRGAVKIEKKSFLIKYASIAHLLVGLDGTTRY